jgi:hypothetical protein
MGEETRQARRQVAAARTTLATEVDGLTEAARSAVDLKAKVRKNPGRTAALAGGVAFMALRGPQRIARRVVRTVRGDRQEHVRSLLPAEVERIVARLGPDADQVRGMLERDFADYIEHGRAGRKKARASQSQREAFWKLFDTLSGPVAARAARELAARLFEPEGGKEPQKEG